ncbi:hypothetical protein [Mycoplasma sp. Ms02]|uniref:hypothetical protein n=1 Tax=Mycoplasma sp. Ms02 TaxID=353851 RepID=UPI001C893F03|nr:hypothetical protein [Mycoplasma sp. Ms02]QZE12439.1 hypothetical protein K4L35_00390 [Mycoplasma sp. Ms02]
MFGKDEFIKKVLIVFFALFTVSNVIFLMLWKVNFGLFFGYSIGALAVFFNFWLHDIYVYFVMKSKNSSARKMGLLSFFWTIFTLSLLGLHLIAILLINQNAKINLNVAHPWNLVDRPINIFSFIGGLSTLVIAIIIANIIEFLKKSKKERGLNG